MVKKPVPVSNKYDWSIKLLNYWWQLAFIMVVGGLVYFVLQIRSLQCGNIKIEKQPIETRRSK